MQKVVGYTKQNNNDYDDDNNNNNYNKQQLYFNGFFSLYIHVKLVLLAIYVFCVALCTKKRTIFASEKEVNVVNEC